MQYADIPVQAKPLEVAILLLYDPAKDNKKEIRHILHIKQMRTVRNVIAAYKEEIRKGSVGRTLISYSFKKGAYTSD